ncbi:MAG: hypothetical protein M1834_004800 [Cirrosporium novae-zelandiae]|nr:MAG: hypothetical protein M1834_004800 [Cirrosporium novae-zelandiae]
MDTVKESAVVEHTENELAIQDGSGSSLTMSLNSEGGGHRFENGRRYHTYHAGQYDMPNDDKEQERLDLQHDIMVEALGGKLQAAPIPEDLQEVLDVATGTGKWCTQFADKHPSARVTGVDLSNMQPGWVPPNCFFEVDDCECDWLYKRKFDLIHARALSAGWKDWDKLCRQAFAFCKPGGFFELQEICLIRCDCPSGSHPIPPFVEYCNYIGQAATQKGIIWVDPETNVERMKKIGFVNIHVLSYKAYIVDPLMKKDLLNGLEGFGLSLLTNVLGWSRNQFEVYLTEVRRSIKEGKTKHLYMPIVTIYGEKPKDRKPIKYTHIIYAKGLVFQRRHRGSSTVFWVLCRDIIAVGSLVAEIIGCLREAGGSKSEYQELVGELESLKKALSDLDKLPPGDSRSVNLDSINHATKRCKDQLEEFLGKIKRYDKSLDFVSFRNKGSIVTLNIGGIANLQLANVDRSKIMVFDTGPGNIMIDYVVRARTERGYDKNGELAAKKIFIKPLLEYLNNHVFFTRPSLDQHGGWISGLILRTIF